MILKLEKMAYGEYKGINIRLRTIFQANNKRWFIEITTGVVGEKYEWLIISHLFRIDIEEDKNLNYTKEAMEIINRYYKIHNEYTEDNIIKLFEELGLKEIEIKYCDYEEYDTRDYQLGHSITMKQSSIFDYMDDPQ